MNFITDLSLSKDYNETIYDAVFIMFDRLTKMTHYTVIRKDIDIFTLTELFLYKYVRLYEISDNLIID